ncbi:hypothetical protein IC582_006255 [Cucumis melo]
MTASVGLNSNSSYLRTSSMTKAIQRRKFLKKLREARENLEAASEEKQWILCHSFFLLMRRKG